MPTHKTQAFTLCSLLLAISLFMLGCSRDKEQSDATMAGQGKPLQVEVEPAVVQKVQDFREFTGRTAAADSVEIRARVSGYLLESPSSGITNSATTAPSSNAQQGNNSVRVHEGDLVDKGTLLFKIDPAPYELALEQARGSLSATQAQLERFRLDLSRAQELLDTRSISQADYDLAVANVNEAAGQIANLEAAVSQANLELEFTTVESPIKGYLGRALVTSGNLIQSDQTILTTVVSADPIYVYFNVDERSLLDYRKRIQSGSVKSARNNQIKVRMALANEVDYSHEGIIDFVDNRTDPATGNTQLRARFSNTNGLLSPGLFARISSPFTEEYDAVLVPTRAISMDQQGHYVLLVQDNKAVRQKVELGTVHDDKTVVTFGLRGNESIIVNGLQRIRPGMDVIASSSNTNNDPASPTTAEASSTVSPLRPQTEVRPRQANSQESSVDIELLY